VSAVLGPLRAAAAGAADLLLPASCNGCGAAEASAGGLCEACARRLLALVALPYCPCCGSTLPPNVSPREDGCPNCPSGLPRFGRVVRLGPYTDPLRPAIRRLKYRRNEEMVRRLGGLLAEAVRTHCGQDPPDLVAPTPMFWLRRWLRGHDHARCIARAVARPLGLPFREVLRRTRDTPPQVNLSRTARLKNIRGAFSVTDGREVAGSHVLLVDDVTTTGATACEAARTLRGAGASRVSVAVAAKSERASIHAAVLARMQEAS